MIYSIFLAFNIKNMILIMILALKSDFLAYFAANHANFDWFTDDRKRNIDDS